MNPERGIFHFVLQSQNLQVKRRNNLKGALVVGQQAPLDPRAGCQLSMRAALDAS